MERPRGPAFACGGPMGRLRQGFTLVLKAGVTGACCLVLAQCGQAPGKVDPKYGVSSSPRVVALGEPVPKGGGTYRVGKPYTIGGRTYEPRGKSANYSAEGLASWYGEDFHGRRTANGEVYDMESISAAHPTLPIPSYARVTNLANQTLHHRARQRPRAVSRRPRDRRVGAHRAAARLLRQRRHPRAGRIRRPRRARRLRRHQARGDACAAARRRRARPRSGSRRRGRSCRNPPEPVRGAVPMPADRPFELGHDETTSRIASGSRRAQSRPSAVSRSLPWPPSPERLRRWRQPEARPRPASKAAGPDEWERGFAARFAPANSLPAAPAGRPRRAGIGLCRARAVKWRRRERPRALLGRDRFGELAKPMACEPARDPRPRLPVSRHSHARKRLLSISREGVLACGVSA